MAFTTSEAAAIRHALGYPQVYRHANPRLESALAVVGGDIDAATIVRGLLASIAGVRAQIEAVALPSAGVSGLDKGGVELHGAHAQIAGMRKIGRGYVGELSGLFGVPRSADIFGESGYQGDGWKANNGLSTIAGLG